MNIPQNQTSKEKDHSKSYRQSDGQTHRVKFGRIAKEQILKDLEESYEELERLQARIDRRRAR